MNGSDSEKFYVSAIICQYNYIEVCAINLNYQSTTCNSIILSVMRVKLSFREPRYQILKVR